MSEGKCIHTLAGTFICLGSVSVHCQIRADHDGEHRFVEMTPRENAKLTITWVNENKDPRAK